MKRFALLSAAALIGAGTLASSAAEARGGGALAAGIIGGLAAGALIGAATQAHAAPAYGYEGGYGGYGYAPAPVVVRPAPAYRVYEEDAPVYATRRTVTYERVPVGYDSRPVRHWHRGWDDGYGW
ncbi:hypothetical protein MKK88_20295 [Methylobacterium sp. E-005]|uniref:hypothetical protein n=1 Tax=Methylobacterium sp. E-005 TaxID=2836549 RepID=UPI001FBA5979|nr:hypothetical protein [Methylobacterium sp. E-005]MCJ2088307.1 hypothetical protein [Methylobacterium sp. E-005]